MKFKKTGIDIKNYNILSILLVSLFILMINFDDTPEIIDMKFIKDNLYIIFFIIIFIIYIFSILVKYLDGSKEKEENINTLYHDKIQHEFELIQKELIDLKNLKDSIKLTDNDKEKITSLIVEKASIQKIEELYKNQTDKLKNDLIKSLGINNIKESFSVIVKRFENELSILRRRSSINLSIGIFITILALAALFYSIHEFYIDLKLLNAEQSLQEILILLFPRLSIVIFIEIFAFFFLRLYAKSLDEIKYFQNELTNIESKLISAEIAYITDDKESLKKSLYSLSKTERNFILKKGETTVELERAKSESENMQNIIKAIPDLFKNKVK